MATLWESEAVCDSPLDEALRLAAAGLHVFPLAVGEKVPMGHLAPRGQNDATTDPETIARWWTSAPSANVGIACAQSGIYVVDIDVRDGAGGAEAWRALMATHGHTPTRTVRTWSGGAHYYYRMPRVSLRNTARKLGPGIDTRGNGYVVAPPSIVGGMPYVMAGSDPIAELPTWIVDALAPPIPVHSPVPVDAAMATASTVVHAPAAEVHARVEQLAAELRDAPDGTGNDTAARIAYMVGGYVGAGQLSEGEAIEALGRAVAGWTWVAARDEMAMRQTIARQVAEGAKRPRPWEAARFLASEVTAAPGVTEAEEELPTAASDWGTDQGQARYLARHLGGMAWATGIGWLLWDGMRWREADEVRVAHIIGTFYKTRFDHHVDRYKETLDPIWNERANMYRRFMSASRTTAIMKSLCGECSRMADEMDSDPDLLNTPAGVVDLRTGAVSPHDPALLMTKITSGNYVAGMRHPDWEAALESLPADVRAFFQLRAGQATTGRTPESDDALVLQGNGANGKSLMASDGIMPALGDYAMLAAPGLILASSASGGASPERASVRGARFVLVEELPEGRNLSIEEIKRIVGTSSITARKLHEQLMTFTTSHTLFVTTNYLPGVSETDDGAWRRLCLINFPYRFTGSPSSADERLGDPALKRRVRLGEQGQHDAIVTWLVEGAMAHYRDPLAVMAERRPARVVADCRAWRASADRILAYWDSRVIADPSSMVAKADVYADFLAYLAEMGHTKWSQETFFGRLSKHELFRKAGATEARVRSLDGLSRPQATPGMLWSSDMPALGTAPRVIKGLRFRTNDDDERDAS